MRDLSILIPARNEMFLARTIQDILENIEMDTEIIAVLDGEWANPPIPQHERVNVVYLPESVGQRAATNVAARLAQGKYVAKVDAHTAYDKGFDRKMIEAFQITGDNVVMVPIMRNLHAFDWKCYSCGYRKYQGPTPEKCEKCGGTKLRRKTVWQPRRGTYSQSYSFDSEPHFQYFSEYKNTPGYIEGKAKNGLTESMSLQGSFFMCTLDNYWKLKMSDESLGNWGNQGIELACKMWLSGGKVIINHNTWYAHMFRTQGGDFSFPYPQSGRGVEKTKRKVWDYFFDGKFEHQIKPVSWLVEKFWPIPGWSDEALKELKNREKNN